MFVTRQRLYVAIAVIFALLLGAAIGRRFDAPAAPLGASMAATKSGDSARHPAQMRSTRAASAGTSGTSSAPKVPAPLPPPGTPLKQTIAELEDRADDGDAAAAARLYRDLRRCNRARQSTHVARSLAMLAMDNKNGKLTAEDMQHQQHLLESAQKALAFVRDSAVLCDGLDDDQLDKFVPSTLRAGRLGDADATSCYLGSILSMQQGLLDHPEWLTDYKDHALDLANSSVKRGDWTTVKLLASSYQGVFFGDALNQVTGTDVAEAYKYLRLWRLGAPAGSDTGRLDAQLEEAAAELPTGAVAAADAWAQETWQKSFVANPQTSPGGNINLCQDADR
jgi:hypothetical protein